MHRQGEVLAFNPTTLNDNTLAQNGLVLVPLAFRPDETIRIGSQVGGFSNGVQNKVYGEVFGNIMSTDSLRKAAAMAMQQSARIHFELPSGYSGDIYHHNGSHEPEIFASPKLVDHLKKYEKGRNVAFLALVSNNLFQRFRPNEFGGSLYTRASGVEGIQINNVYGLTTSDIDSLLGPQGLDGLTDGILDSRLWPTYRLLNLRANELPS